MIRMARRLLTFALAFVIIGAPVAGDICEAACARHSGRSSRNEPASHYHHLATGASHAAHHHEAAAERTGSSNSAEMIPESHGCDHVDAVLTASREALRVPVPNAVSAVAHIEPVVVRALPPIDVDSRHGPPARLRSTSPLRI